MNDFDFGNYLCGLRVGSGLSQKELAARLGVSDKAVSKWENGRSKPSSQRCFALQSCSESARMRFSPAANASKLHRLAMRFLRLPLRILPKHLRIRGVST